MNKKTYHVGSKDTSIAVHDNNPILLNEVFELLKGRGFLIQTDQHILKEYPSLAKTHWEGNKGDLLFKANIYPAGFKLEFYQNINFSNKSGGYYDFDKFEKMPYLIRLQYIVARNAICSFLEEKCYTNTAKPEFKKAMDEVRYRIQDSWHFEKGQEVVGYTPEKYNNKDRDKKTIYNGQMKYFYGHDGRLRKGIVYHNINNMWWVILNEYEFTNISSFRLFDIEPGANPKRRIQRKTMPERIRVKKLREKFLTLGLSYSVLNESHIRMLRTLLAYEFKDFNGEITFSLSQERKKDTKVLKRTGLQYAFIRVDGDYFSKREAISFNPDGFIGFAGWASGYNLKPFADAFNKWLDWLTEALEIAI